MKKIIIKEENKNKRLDKFLAKEFFSYSRGEIASQIKIGKVLLNKKIVKPSYVLKINDNIEIFFPEKIITALLSNSAVKLRIIHQDKNIIVVEKPAGISVHPASKNDEKNTLVNGLIAKFPEIIGVGDNLPESNLRPGIVHRLDKETSGVIVIARNQKAFDQLKNLFKNREVEKKYLALVLGKMPNKKGVIEKPLAKSSDYKKQVIANRRTRTKIKNAITEYTVLREFRDCSLLEISPKTGRTHQIRIHLASVGHPVVGDKLYKSQEVSNLFPRHLLHASEISFSLFGKKHSYKSPIPKDFKEFLAQLEK
jgi:23S rRNA pseudouridine1911/1915/1917 synthase